MTYLIEKPLVAVGRLFKYQNVTTRSCENGSVDQFYVCHNRHMY